MKSFNLAVIAGDGIGPEVVNEGLKVLDAVAKKYDLNFNKTNYELGAAYWHKTGETLPDSVMAELAKADVILLGAVGDPTVPSGVLERGLLLKLRFAFEHYINLRPAKLFPGVTSPITNNKGIDFVVVREGTEGLYVGAGSIKDEGTNKELAIEESINTYKGVERVIRDAFNRAKSRPRKKLTLVHKNNVLTRAGGLWSRVFKEVANDFPEVTTDYLHVDAASMFFVTNPERFDVVVTDNLFGDIITDIAAAICGGIGLAASGNINPTGEFPSMFEPVHGSAPDIAGKNLADPTATVLSVAMMLNHLGQSQAAADVENAVAQDLLSRGDKKRTTTEIGQALVKGVS
ncbi:MAG: 3-isopropylmalate dehydrogenase [Actinobacteria bacterium]|jgi:3-isopropylmalate dehydrogenase|uniref:3-isopropylmalate dehydrogenase n=1 Tax=freshwater metagenome TaxID=449393 RepID=A0A6J6UQ06_9ZZZZ|nr:3-isopropylmalate dehydrogenase [Actinomycetota bacterium]MSW18542.1 3-isopropylmalate dehydrogenase [Actinomycetota bacterium]MSX27099.1 3-isopropylmalate dehydrogenase [Actinomycetota bacterium]MSY10753.1 3-isopropylmalate dehydrogenase [Actinomycetota bacterium]